MVPYVDIIGLCHSVAILLEIYVMWHKCHVSWLRFHFQTNANHDTLSIDFGFMLPKMRAYVFFEKMSKSTVSNMHCL